MIGLTFSPLNARMARSMFHLHDLAVEEQRRVGVALAVVGGVQRAEAELRLGDDHVARLDLVVEQVVELAARRRP